MALRPLAFGARFREKGRTVALRSEPGRRRHEVQVESGPGRRQRRRHGSSSSALRDFAATWRSRLH